MSETIAGADRARGELSAGRSALVWRRIVADTHTPVGAALALIEEGRGDFLLESVEGGEVRGRYSLLGLDPDLVFRAHGAVAEINPRWQRDRDGFARCEDDALAALRNLVASCRIDVPDGLPPALACLVGYFGYETIALVEKLERPKSDPLGLPDMLFVRPTIVLVFDRLSEELFCVAPIWASDGAPEPRIAVAAARIDEVRRRLDLAPAPAAPRQADHPVPELVPTMAGEDYAAGVHRAKEYIAAGDIF